MDAERDEIDVRELALREMVAALPEAERADALLSLLDEMETMHRRAGAAPPAWIPRFRARLREEGQGRSEGDSARSLDSSS